MRDKFFINPVNGQYESTKYTAPTHSNLMKSIGRPDVAKALDKNKKKIVGVNKKTVGALDVAAAEGRDILAEQLNYKWDSSSGKFFNGSGKSVDTMAEANKSNDEVALFAPGGEGKQFQEQFKRDRQTALKGFYPKPYERLYENTLRNIQGKKKKPSDLDLMFEVADIKDKAGMRRRYKDYNFDKREFKEDIKKTEPVKLDYSDINKHYADMDSFRDIQKQTVADEKKLEDIFNDMQNTKDEDLNKGLGSLLGANFD